MQALPRPEDLVAGLAMAEHEGAVYEDSMVRLLHNRTITIQLKQTSSKSSAAPDVAADAGP